MTLVTPFEEMGIPFTEDSGDLLSLHTKDRMEADVVQSVTCVCKVGQEQYDLFVQDRFVDKTKYITDPLHKNKLPLFSRKKAASKQKTQVAALKDDCALFSRLYIACQSRDGNLEEFFKHEN